MSLTDFVSKQPVGVYVVSYVPLKQSVNSLQLVIVPMTIMFPISIRYLCVPRPRNIFLRRRSKSSVIFAVRRLETANEVGELICARAAALGRKPGALDHLSYIAADPTGFFVGELDGRVISCISAVKYSNEYAVIGNYIVDKPYQDKGYGLATWKAALSSLAPGCNFVGDTTEHLLSMYENLFAYKHAWKNQRNRIIASQGLLALSDAPAVQYNIRPVSELPFAAIVDYDTSIHVYARSSFLKQWIYAPNCYAFAATNDDGAMVGYTVVRTLRDKHSWRIGPLFADNSQIAKSLYRTVIDKVAITDPSAAMFVDVPTGDLPNPEASTIMRELSATPTRSTIRVYAKNVPSKLQLSRIFGMTSLSL